MILKKDRIKKEFTDKIEKAFISLLQTKDFKEISVSDICSITGLPKSIFYANYLNIYELAEKIRFDLESDFGQPFRYSPENLWENKVLFILYNIYDNQMLYKTYFKLGYNVSHQIYLHDVENTEADPEDSRLDYHIEYFRSGFNAIVQKWLNDGCKETPEEIHEIFIAEYHGR